MSRDAQEFIPLTEDAARAVSGPSSRHAALLEDAFRVLVETPGGGVLLKGDTAGRAGAKRAVQTIATRAETGARRVLGQGDEFLRVAAHAGSLATSISGASSPVRLFMAELLIRTGTIRPISAAGPSAWTACR